MFDRFLVWLGLRPERMLTAAELAEMECASAAADLAAVRARSWEVAP